MARIHTTYDQTGTSTGRISSNDPNLQNIPVKTSVGREIRSAFERGERFETLLTADYSQIEMRIMAHLSGDEGLILAFNEGEDLHRFVGARIFGVEPADVTPIMRTKVKAMSYGLAYGLSAFGLSKQLRIETAEAKQLMADYFLRFGAVREYLRNVVEQARVDGYTETIFGRRRPFGDLTSNNRVLRENAERAALNAPIQGSAADILKIAMLGIADDLRSGGTLRRTCSCRCTTNSCSRSPTANWMPSPRSCATGWGTPPTCGCRSTCRSARARTGTRPRTSTT